MAEPGPSFPSTAALTDSGASCMGRKIAFTAAAAGTLLSALLLMEAFVHFTLEPPDGTALILVDREAPYAFALNPEHAEISSQGFRDREFALPKPAGTKRFLMLGDSTTYGLFVSADQTFSKKLEDLLNTEGLSAEVMNAGVNGYTTYNEVEFFKSAGKNFEADDVVLVFCLNDIVNPVLHWGDDEGFFRSLSEAAFPRYDEHLSQVVPEVYGEASFWEKTLRHSALYRYFKRIRRLWDLRAVRYEEKDGRRWPVYVSDESPVTLRVLENPDSPESRWLFGLFRELQKSTARAGANLHILFLPLAYQMDPAYPFLPQKTLMESCAKEGLDCLDPLETFRTQGGSALFLGRHRYHPRDIWHLSPRGHEVTARFLADALVKQTKGGPA